jgi:ribonuclease D
MCTAVGCRSAPNPPYIQIAPNLGASQIMERENKMKKKGPSKEVTALLEPFLGLPLEQVIVPATQEEFAVAAAEIKAAGIAGFDTESKPTFNVGDVSKGPHVVQFSIHEKAFIFQVHREAARPFLVELLQSQDVLKVGFGLKSDHSQIRAKFGTGLNAVLDLDSVFRKDGYSGDMGVRAAIGLVLNQNFRKSKSITTTNWSLHELSAPQLLYAANDAYAALKVYEGLKLSRPELLASTSE